MSTANTALAGLYRAHASELRCFARRRVGRQEAEDVVQDAYLHLLQRGTAATLDHPRPYLFRIAANLTVDCVRKTNIRLRHAGESLEFVCNAEATPSPEAAAGGVMDLQRVEASLAELPRLCREAFLLKRIEQLSHAEIARRLGVSVRTVDRYMVKVLDHLRGNFGLGCRRKPAP
ncbi:MAG: sigma-70 family RNA polymerase sigma factor [Beijerinckiaceae bacterium]|nr:sigma-70 family RNA polymerase sigma factor [Beijerinckiaceae bacterium]